MNFNSLQSALAAARAQLAAEGEAALRTADLPSRLAFLLLPVLQSLAAADVGDTSDLLLDLVGKEHRRALLAALPNPADALRNLDASPPLRAACQALLQALDAAPAPPLTTVQRMEAQRIENARQYSAGGDLTVHEAPPDSEEGRRARDLRTYLARTATDCGALPLAQLDPTDADARPLQLSSVYIRLQVTEPIEAEKPSLADRALLRRREHPREREAQTALQALALAPEQRLLLLGRPGSGKSTFLNHLAFCLAEAYLAQQRGDNAASTQWTERLEGWARGALLPVRIILRDFARFAPLATAAQGDAALVFDFLEETLRRAGCAAALEPIKHALENGRAALLLDGLDEVVDKPTLRRVGECIAALVGGYRQCPALVTCRILDYQDEPLRHLAAFAVRTLDDLTTEQAEQFVRDWYGTLAASGRRTPQQAEDDTRALLDAIAAREELRDLASLPLLLTLTALVHAHKGSLPDARALLYDDCVDLLLRWRQPRGEATLVASLELSEFRQSDLLSLLAQLGYEAHAADTLAATSGAPPADLSGPQVLQSFARGLARFDPIRNHELAARLLRALARGNGLLLQRGPDVYTFPHRTFQEFLAAYHLLGQLNYFKRCAEHAAETHWHEALLLMVGYQIFKSNDLERPLILAGQLLEGGPAEQVLAGEILNLLGRERVGGAQPELLAPRGLWHRARARLLALLTQGQAPTAPAVLRHRAGLAAGKLCYGGVAALAKGTAPPLPDARLPLVFVGTTATTSPVWRRAFDTYWCDVGQGPFWYGDDTKGALQQVTLPYSYQIARYPVTNADFARFVATGGYHERGWWTANGWQWLQETKQTQPVLFDSTRYNNPIQPVVGVTWYEAAAYCNWLDAQLRAANLLDATSEIRLPTSLEWERAARHTDQRRYPWGDPMPTPEHANYDATALGLPSPVGCFPQGRTVCGALDMSGNVDEWTATLWEKLEQQTARKDFTQDDTPVYRWKSSYDNIERMCCGSRDRNNPDDRDFIQGFRLVRSLRARV